MCKTGNTPDRPLEVNGVVFDVAGCPKGYHGTAQVAGPTAGAFTIEARGDTREALAQNLGAVLQDVEETIDTVERCGLGAGLLACGISIVAPGKKVEKIPADAEARLDALVEFAVAQNDARPIADNANTALIRMGPAFRKKDRREAEGAYAALVRAGLRRGLVVTELQAMVNGSVPRHRG